MTWAIPPIRTAGIASGLALAALMVLAFWVPASSQRLGAGVRITAMAPGEVHVPDSNAFLRVGKLTPGGKAARATLPLTNVTRGPLDVRLRARMASHELDRALHLQLREGGRVLASGTLADLRGWTRPLRLERAGESTVRVRAWIPAGADNTAGHRVAVKLELDAQLVKAARR
jgi:hypothetical protein